MKQTVLAPTVLPSAKYLNTISSLQTNIVRGKNQTLLAKFKQWGWCLYQGLGYRLLQFEADLWYTSELLIAQLCLTLCDPMDCSPPGSSVHGNSPGKNTGVGCHSLLQGIFPNQGSNLGLLNCRQILYHLSHQESPNIHIPKYNLLTASFVLFERYDYFILKHYPI